MQKDIIISGNTVTIDTDTSYSGAAELRDAEKLVRKVVGLPVTKQLVYYTDSNKAVPISNYSIKEFFDGWFVIEITLTNGDTHNIHSTYLAEMQKPSFVADMARQAAEIK